jgi:AcrR family transcriptional regulator
MDSIALKKPVAKRPERGLRSKQKELRHEQILLAAGQLFMEQGFDETTMEDIANRATISVPTVYSYFASKSDLLFALFKADEILLEPRIERMLKRLPKDPVEAIVSVELAALREGYDLGQKRVWREISAAALRSSSEKRAEYAALQELRVGWLAQVFDLLKSRGQMRPDIDSIVAMGRNTFRMYVMKEDMTIGEMESQIHADIALAFNGMATSGAHASPGAARSTLDGRPERK